MDFLLCHLSPRDSANHVLAQPELEFQRCSFPGFHVGSDFVDADMKFSPRNGLAIGWNSEFAHHRDDLRAQPRTDAIDERYDRSEERRVGKECRSRWSP